MLNIFSKLRTCEDDFWTCEDGWAGLLLLVLLGKSIFLKTNCDNLNKMKPAGVAEAYTTKIS